jgi:hypothetical protein
VAISQDTFDQLARYNAVLGAPVLVTDNGQTRYCCQREPGGWRFLDVVPAYDPG